MVQPTFSAFLIRPVLLPSTWACPWRSLQPEAKLYNGNRELAYQCGHRAEVAGRRVAHPTILRRGTTFYRHLKVYVAESVAAWGTE